MPSRLDCNAEWSVVFKADVKVVEYIKGCVISSALRSKIKDQVLAELPSFPKISLVLQILGGIFLGE